MPRITNPMMTNIVLGDMHNNLSRMLKMQHPDYELSQQGPHARAGISCADCHMPYVTEGSARVTDHAMRPPSRNLLAACQVCHLWSEAELHDSIVAPQRATRLARDILDTQNSESRLPNL